jgi:hypothetical protein
MVIDYLSFLRTIIISLKAHSPLAIDPDAVLAFPFAFEGFKTM